MTVNKIIIIFVFAIVTLLSCSFVSSLNIIPRVSRTSDAIILDYSEEPYDFLFQSKNDQEIADAGLPLVNYYPTIYQQQPNFYKGWSYFYGYPSPISPPVVPSNKQLEELEEDNKQQVETADQRQAAAATTTTTAAPTTTTTAAATTTTTAAATTTTTAAPAPAAMCGKGALATPTSRSLISERVAGGSDAKTHSWTFLVSLFNGASVFCGGTLLSATKVLTAASCFEKMSQFQISGVVVQVGGYKSDQSDAQMTRRISKVAIHSKYNSATFASDIAILTLDMPVVFYKDIGPVCLPPASIDADDSAGKSAVIIGWGQSPAAVVSLQQALVAVGYNVDCQSDTNVGKFMSSTTSCLASFDGSTPMTRFTCPSDVGGPVLVNIAPNVQGTNAIWTQVGINSFTPPGTDPACASNGLKTRVSAFIPWINTYMVLKKNIHGRR